MLPGPAGCTNYWGDGSATQYKTNMSSYVVADTAVSTCATPIGQVGESTAPGINVVDASSVVGIGDLILTDDGKLIAANANDGHLYTGPILATATGTLTQIASSSLSNVAYIKPAANDVLESNVLAVPDTDTDPANTPTNNDVPVSVVLGPLPATGSRTRGPLTLGLVFFGLGAAMVLVARKPRALS